MIHTSTLLNWRSRNRAAEPEFSWNPRQQGFIEKYRVGEVVRGLVFSSVLWGLLAVGVYTVYSMVLGVR